MIVSNTNFKDNKKLIDNKFTANKFNKFGKFSKFICESF